MTRGRIISNLALITGFAVLCVAMGGWLAFNIGLHVPGQSGYRLIADFSEATGVVTQDEVRVSGVKVGSVVDLTPAPGGGTRVTMQLDPKIRMRSDVRAVIRPKSLLGTKYVELVRTPGSSASYLPSGAVIPKDQTGEAVEIDSVLNNMDPETRTAFSETLRQLGVALDGRASDVNQSITNLDQVTANLRPLAQIGDRRQEEIARILTDLAIIMQALADEQDALGTLIDSGDQVFAGIAARDADLGGAVANANGFFGSLDAVFSTPGVTQADRTSLANAPSTIIEGQHTLSLLNTNSQQFIPALLIGQVSYPADQLTISNPESVSLAAEWISAFSQHDINGNSFRITNITGNNSVEPPSSQPPSSSDPNLPGVPGLPVPTPDNSPSPAVCLIVGIQC